MTQLIFTYTASHVHPSTDLLWGLDVTDLHSKPVIHICAFLAKIRKMVQKNISTSFWMGKHPKSWSKNTAVASLTIILSFMLSFLIFSVTFCFYPLLSPFEQINIAGRLLKRAAVCGRFRSCTTLGPVLHSRPNHGTPSLYPTRPKHYVLHNGMN